MPRLNRFSSHREIRLHTQAGTVLIMSLVLLTVLTLIGVSSMSSSTLELKIASNSQQHNLAFQAAQSSIAFATSDDDANTSDFLVAIADLDDPTSWPVQTCGIGVNVDVGVQVDLGDVCPGGTNWVAKAALKYLDCHKGIGSSLEAGKGFSFRVFEVKSEGSAKNTAGTVTAKSIQASALRYPVKGCGDEIL